MKFFRVIPLIALLTGCAIQKFNKPPTWASVVTTHARFFGLNVSIPYGGQSILKVQLGWGSETWSVVPVATNRVYAATVSDTFSLGQDLNPFNTTIKEDVQTGWEPNNTPIPRLKFFKEPKALP